MKIEIESRYTGEVLFEHEAEGNTIEKTLEAAVKACADLTDANLAGANLTGADLRSANLTDAYLRGANLIYAIGNGREIMSAQVWRYRIVYTSEFMWIGCRKHPVKTWWKDSEKDAHRFTEEQKEWRAKNKRWIQAMVKNNPAVPTGKEIAK